MGLGNTTLTLKGLSGSELSNVGDSILRQTLLIDINFKQLSSRFKTEKKPNQLPFDSYSSFLQCLDGIVDGGKKELERFEYLMQQSPSIESIHLAMRVCQSPVLSKGTLKFEGLLNQSVLIHATNSLSKPLNLQKLLGQVIFEDDIKAQEIIR